MGGTQVPLYPSCVFAPCVPTGASLTFGVINRHAPRDPAVPSRPPRGYDNSPPTDHRGIMPTEFRRITAFMRGAAQFPCGPGAAPPPEGGGRHS